MSSIPGVAGPMLHGAIACPHNTIPGPLHTCPNRYMSDRHGIPYSRSHLPGILFRLERPQHRPYPVNDLIENGVAVIDRREGRRDRPVKDYPFLPRYISVNVEGWTLEYWMRLDPRLKYQDIIARMNPLGDNWALPGFNSLQMRRLRGSRTPLGLSCWTSRRDEITKVEVETVQNLTWDQVRYNTTMDIQYAPRLDDRGSPVRGQNDKIVSDNTRPMQLVKKNLLAGGPVEYRPMHHFLDGNQIHTPSQRLTQALDQHFDLDTRAFSEGLEDWHELPDEFKPYSWRDRNHEKRTATWYGLPEASNANNDSGAANLSSVPAGNAGNVARPRRGTNGRTRKRRALDTEPTEQDWIDGLTKRQQLSNAANTPGAESTTTHMSQMNSGLSNTSSSQTYLGHGFPNQRSNAILGEGQNFLTTSSGTSQSHQITSVGAPVDQHRPTLPLGSLVYHPHLDMQHYDSSKQTRNPHGGGLGGGGGFQGPARDIEVAQGFPGYEAAGDFIAPHARTLRTQKRGMEWSDSPRGTPHELNPDSGSHEGPYVDDTSAYKVTVQQATMGSHARPGLSQDGYAGTAILCSPSSATTPTTRSQQLHNYNQHGHTSLGSDTGLDYATPVRHRHPATTTPSASSHHFTSYGPSSQAYGGMGQTGQTIPHPGGPRAQLTRGATSLPTTPTHLGAPLPANVTRRYSFQEETMTQASTHHHFAFDSLPDGAALPPNLQNLGDNALGMMNPEQLAHYQHGVNLVVRQYVAQNSHTPGKASANTFQGDIGHWAANGQNTSAEIMGAAELLVGMHNAEELAVADEVADAGVDAEGVFDPEFTHFIHGNTNE